MDLTPRDIQQKQFHDTFRGYSHEEVDMFLDEVAEAFDRVFRENQTFHHRMTELEANLSQARGSEDMLKRMLVTAQETADKAVQEARERASSMVATSQTKSEEILSGAEKRAGDIVTQASERAEKIVEDAVSKERELQVRIEALKHFEAEYRARIKAFIESQLEVVAKGAELPSLPGETTLAVTTNPAPVSVERAEPQARDEPGQPTVSIPAEPVRIQPAAAAPIDPRPAPSTSREDSAPAPNVRVDAGAEQVPAKVAAGGLPGDPEASDVPDQDRSIRELFWGEE